MPKLNILVAFPYFKQQVIDIIKDLDPNEFRLIVDSGAFTAYNTGRAIDIDEYCKFLKSLPKDWNYHAVQLDVYGDPEQTYINFLKMKELGFDVMPVFTRGDTLERLEEFYQHTDYIMFGGIVVGGENKNYVKWFCENNKGRKAHWLGFVNTDFIRKYKPESVDSSTVFGTQRFGWLYIATGHGALPTIHKTEFAKRPPQWVMDGLKKVGCTMNDIRLLGQKEAWTGGSSKYIKDKSTIKAHANLIGVKSHVYRAIEVEKHLGTKIYLACGNAEQIKLLTMAFNELKERNCI